MIAVIALPLAKLSGLARRALSISSATSALGRHSLSTTASRLVLLVVTLPRRRPPAVAGVGVRGRPAQHVVVLPVVVGADVPLAHVGALVVAPLKVVQRLGGVVWR